MRELSHNTLIAVNTVNPDPTRVLLLNLNPAHTTNTVIDHVSIPKENICLEDLAKLAHGITYLWHTLWVRENHSIHRKRGSEVTERREPQDLFHTHNLLKLSLKPLLHIKISFKIEIRFKVGHETTDTRTLLVTPIETQKRLPSIIIDIISIKDLELQHIDAISQHTLYVLPSQLQAQEPHWLVSFKYLQSS